MKKKKKRKRLMGHTPGGDLWICMCVYTHFVLQVFFLEHYFYQTRKPTLFKKRILACFGILTDGKKNVLRRSDSKKEPGIGGRWH